MADESFAIGVAVGLQAAFGTADPTIAGLTSPLTSSDGIILGDREAGDFESGITIPDFVRVFREQADVSGSFTPSATSFLRVDAEGMEIQWLVKGNAATPSPAVGEAKPVAGIDALHEMAGLIGANGGAGVEYDYTPRHSGSSGGSTKYGTIKLWVADMSWVLQDCVCESLRFTVTPSGVVVARASIRAGSHDPSTQFADSVTFPTFTYGVQASAGSLTVESVTTTYGTARGWESLEIEIANTLEQGQDSSKTSGVRTRQTERKINVTARLFVDTADSDFDYQELFRTTAPTADISFQLGSAGATPIEAFSFGALNIAQTQSKPEPEGDVTVFAIEGNATATTAGGEALFQYN